MSGHEETARHERAAVAYVHRQATDAGLIWREITGQDIGIDAILELPYADEEEHSVRGFVLLQVKARSRPVIGGKLQVVYKKRHHLYWLTQRLPLLVCVVETSDTDDFSTGVSSHWIDYKSLKPEQHQITEDKNQRWTLRIPLDSPHVWPSKSKEYPDWSSQAAAFRNWIESVVTKSAEAIVKTLCESADGYLGSGKPAEARTCLKQIPIWEEVLLKANTRRSTGLLIAKTIRRTGAVDEQEKFARQAGRYRNSTEIAQYELALTYWTRACMTRFPKADLASWRSALKILRRPRAHKESAIGVLRRDLLRLSAYVNIRATLSCLPGMAKSIPDEKLCRDLREVIGLWRNSKEESVISDPRYELQLLNALRALCRGHLSRREVTDAQRVLDELRREMEKNPDRETLALTDFLLLNAWIAIENGKWDIAAATLECTKYLLKSMHDPLLEWFQDVIVRKWEKMKDAPTLSRA